MKLYHIKDDYVDLLRKSDLRVEENKNESRPYVGVVLSIGDIEYYAPLTSPKTKHQNMKNGKDFRKIANGTYGAINFCNMIPVASQALMLVDIQNTKDERYKRLLQNQYKAIKSDKDAIIKTAQELHDLVLKNDDELTPYDLRVKKRCCNLALLESICKQYEQLTNTHDAIA